MDPDELKKLVEENPIWALEEFSHLLTPPQFDFCIRKEPWFALYFRWVCEKMLAEQFDFCCRLHPASALFCRRKLNPEQTEFCCEEATGYALQLHCCEKFNFNLTKAQFVTCCGKAPALALEYGATLMDEALFTGCVRAAPAAALKHVPSLMDEYLFRECVEAEPWEAVKVCADRLSDDELVRHSAGCGEALSTLLEFEPSHPLKLKLASLFGRLDPAVEFVVTLALAPGI